MSKILLEEQKYDEALSYLQKALMLNLPDFKDSMNFNQPIAVEKAYRVDYLIETLENKGLVFEAINTKESRLQALKNYQLAIEWIEKMRQDVVFEGSKINIQAYTARVYQAAFQLNIKLYQTTSAQQYLENAFSLAEQQKAILLLENLINEDGKTSYKVPNDMLERERRLKNDVFYYQQKRAEVNAQTDSALAAMYDNYYNKNSLALASLTDTLANYYKDYLDLEQQNSIATIATIQNDLLQKNEVFVEYIQQDSLMYVFVIEQEQAHLEIIPLDNDNRALLKDLQANLSDYQSIQQDGLAAFQSFKTLSHEAYQIFFEPIAKLTTIQNPSFTVVTDGLLNLLPFEVLLEKEVRASNIDFIQLPYLLKQYTFRYGYSGTLLLKNKEKSQRLESNNRLLAYAPPYQNQSQLASTRGELRQLRDNTAPLEGAAKEIQSIAKYFEGDFDVSTTATETNFKAKASDFGILHLAVHGIPNVEQADFAYLLFANAPKDSLDDGKLHHYEISNLETNAQLAVLSACETGIGQEISGEGIKSLGKGFMYAGVPSIVMSTWKMDDIATSELMPLFYKNLADEMPKDKALHEAKLQYLVQTTKERAHPFYWAGLISLGDNSAIQSNINYSLYWWIAIALVLLTLIPLRKYFFR